MDYRILHEIYHKTTKSPLSDKERRAMIEKFGEKAGYTKGELMDRMGAAFEAEMDGDNQHLTGDS